MHSIVRYHDFSAGHRVCGHEGKCQHLHGHNYRIHFTCVADTLDELGRVIDFSQIKALLCEWLETHWDHRMLIWENDPLKAQLLAIDTSVVVLPFNPTAELMAQYLVETLGPVQLAGTGIRLLKVQVDETRKCSASFEAVRL